MKGLPTRILVPLGILVALLLAGVVSHYASSEPDGLNRVAADQGFAEEESARDAPLAGYSARGIEDDRVAGGLAGVIGVVVVLGLAGGLTFVLRRRTDGGAVPERDPELDQDRA